MRKLLQSFYTIRELTSGHLLTAITALAVLTGCIQEVTAQTRIVFNSPVIAGGSKKTPTYTASQIYAIDSSGSGLTQLTTGNDWAFSPAWNPDGRYISFYKAGFLHVMEAQGAANGGQIFSVAPSLSTGSDWSPDGSKLCFPGSSAIGLGLWIVDLDPDAGAVGVPVSIRAGMCFWPAWSPDGNQIAFNFDTGAGQANQVIKVLDLPSGTEITFPGGPAFYPSWRPDGQEIAFSRPVTITITGRNGRTTTSTYVEIFIADPDGTNARPVTNLRANSWRPTWSPDGTKLAFSSNVSGADSLYSMEVATGAVTLLCTGAQAPNWAP